MGPLRKSFPTLSVVTEWMFKDLQPWMEVKYGSV